MEYQLQDDDQQREGLMKPLGWEKWHSGKALAWQVLKPSAPSPVLPNKSKCLWGPKTQFVGHNKQTAKCPWDEKQYLLNSILKREMEEEEEKRAWCLVREEEPGGSLQVKGQWAPGYPGPQSHTLSKTV